MKFLGVFFLIILSIFSTVVGQEIDIIPFAKIKMRDGIYLNATIYKPNQEKEYLPQKFN